MLRRTTAGLIAEDFPFRSTTGANFQVLTDVDFLEEIDAFCVLLAATHCRCLTLRQRTSAQSRFRSNREFMDTRVDTKKGKQLKTGCES
jgi:hypothetical protein